MKHLNTGAGTSFGHLAGVSLVQRDRDKVCQQEVSEIFCTFFAANLRHLMYAP